MIFGLSTKQTRTHSDLMSTLTKTRKPARKSGSTMLPYGIKPITLPKKLSTVGDLRDMGDAFGKGADLAVIEGAFKARNL